MGGLTCTLILALFCFQGIVLVRAVEVESHLSRVTTVRTHCSHNNDYDLKIYVYDLPPELTVTVSDQVFHDVGDAKVKSSMFALSVFGPDYIRKSPSVVTSDPEEADLFLVDFPVIAHLSSRHFPDTAKPYDEVVSLLKQLRQHLDSLPWLERFNGTDHIVFQTWIFSPWTQDILNVDPSKPPRSVIPVVSEHLCEWPSFPSLSSPVVMPYMDLAVPWLHEREKQHLCSFYGSLRVGYHPQQVTAEERREIKYAVRAKLRYDMSNDRPVQPKFPYKDDCVWKDLIGIRRLTFDFVDVISLMSKSVFCLCPRGDTPATRRIFHAIRNLCIPVIIADNIELPFESFLDYSEFAVFISQRQYLSPRFHLMEHLRSISDRQRYQFKKKLEEVRHHFIYNPSVVCDGDAISMLYRQLESRALILREQRRPLQRRKRYLNARCVPTDPTLH